MALKNMAVTSSAKITGIPENSISVETKKWKPTGVAKGSPPMWYSFHSGKVPVSKIWLMMLPWNPMSELGGYSLWKITAALNANAKQKIANRSKIPLCFVIFTRVANDTHFQWTQFIAFPQTNHWKKNLSRKISEFLGVQLIIQLSHFFEISVPPCPL